MVPSIMKRALVDTRSTIGPGVTAVTSTPGNWVESAGFNHSGVSSSASVSGIVVPPSTVPAPLTTPVPRRRTAQASKGPEKGPTLTRA